MITPINIAEAIIEPFWDPILSGLTQWQIEPDEAHGLAISQNWCWVQFEWARKPAAGPALRMTRRFDLDCRDYDHLILPLVAPEGSIIRSILETDRGTVRFESSPTHLPQKEYAVDLKGAVRLVSVTLEVEAAEEGIAGTDTVRGG